MARYSLLTAALVPLSCCYVLAQTPNHLVGITRGAPALRSQSHSECSLLGACLPAGFPDANALPENAGGTAWDPTTGGAWITNGHVLAKVDDRCDYQCGPFPVPFPTPVNTVLTGLEVVESMSRLFAIDSQGGLHQFTLDCPPQHLGVCNTGLAPGPVRQVTSGLAIDEGLGLVFIAYPDFATDTNVVVVAHLANVCQPVQRLTIPGCSTSTTPFGAFTGLAVDWGRRILYATDGRRTMAIEYAPAAIGVGIVRIDCCTPLLSNLDPMIGLAVRPGGATTFGNNCANGVCPPCPMNHAINNDPNVGNLAFSLRLTDAPVGSLAWDVIGMGACGPPGRQVPPLCGPIWTPHLLGILGPVPTGGVVGGGVCDGHARFALPIPLIPPLVGTPISSQAIVLCSSLTGAIGTAISNCLTFELQGN